MERLSSGNIHPLFFVVTSAGIKHIKRKTKTEKAGVTGLMTKNNIPMPLEYSAVNATSGSSHGTRLKTDFAINVRNQTKIFVTTQVFIAQTQ